MSVARRVCLNYPDSAGEMVDVRVFLLAMVFSALKKTLFTPAIAQRFQGNLHDPVHAYNRPCSGRLNFQREVGLL